MLDAPALDGFALCASNSTSSNVTPVLMPLSSSAYPAAEGATTTLLPVLYPHVAQSSAP
jgi:hypothetical protein